MLCPRRSSGFTLVEVTLVVGIMCILLVISTLSLGNTIPKNNLNTTVQTLVADIKSQQIKALSGEITAAGVPDNMGIYFNNGSYTLFHGSSYSPVLTDNYTVALDHVTVSSTFSLSSLIFLRSTGEIKNYSPTSNTITVTQTTDNSFKVITLDKYGAIKSIN